MKRESCDIRFSKQIGKGQIKVTVIGALGISLLALGIPAHAADIYENLWINSNTDLTGNVIGSIEFKKSGITLDCHGYWIQYGDSFSSPSRCTSETGITYACGISANGYSDITIKNCNIYNWNAFGYGIWVSGTPSKPATNVEISNSYATQMLDSGIFLRNVSQAFINSSTSSNNTDSGLELYGVSDSGVIDCDFDGNGSAGVYEENGSFNSFEVSSFSYNAHGLYSRNSSGTTVWGNSPGHRQPMHIIPEFWGNSVSGITFNGGIGFRVTENFASGNPIPSYGIRVLGSSQGATLDWNEATGNITCDAQQAKSATGITWVHNTFTKRCNVPAQ